MTHEPNEGGVDSSAKKGHGTSGAKGTSTNVTGGDVEGRADNGAACTEVVGEHASSDMVEVPSANTM